MREATDGFYEEHFRYAMVVLLTTSVTVSLLGSVGRRRLGYFTQLFCDDLAHTEPVVNENTQPQSFNYRLSNIIALPGNRKESFARISRH